MDGDEIAGGDNTSGAIGTGNDARVALLDALGDANDRGRADELANVNDDGTTEQFVAPTPDESTGDQEQQQFDQLRTQELAEESIAHTPNERIIRKINGVETEITDELIAKAQKIGAADVYLAEAKRLREQLAQPAPQKPVQVEDDLAEVARAIQMGTEEEAVAALRKLTSRSPSQDDLSRKIDERLIFNEAYGKFCTEFSDIVGDPRLHRMAQDADTDLIRRGDTRSYAERFTAIGNDLRAWVNSKAAPATASEQRADKVERKAAAPSVPKATGGKHVVQSEQEEDESPSEVIRRMAERRGGPQWMNGGSR